MMKAEKKKAFTSALFLWHKHNYRDMPWRPKSRGRDRANFDPYKILVSEIMLQQTQVERVRTKYAEFLKKFPTVEVLAKAPLGEVLRLWSGLGYNRRAKYLHECAKKVVSEYDAIFPHDFDELQKLPGIGISTAAAIRAFAFNEDEPMIDTNIRRILVRTFFMSRRRLDMKFPSDKVLYDFAQSLIPKGKGRMWNYAMLDLGATLCTARNHSNECPLTKLHGRVGDFVYKKPQKKFAGSHRFYRGHALKSISARGSISHHELAGESKCTKLVARAILRELEGEMLIVKKGERYVYPQ